MVRAGFYAIRSSTIRFGRDGRWYADGEPIANRRIADLFSRSLCRDEDGGYVLRIAEERAPVIVEDTPYVVVGVRVDVERRAMIELNDHSVEPLDARSVAVGGDEVLYCRVKGGAERARFLRPAYYQLAPYLAADAAGEFALDLAGGPYRIARA